MRCKILTLLFVLMFLLMTTSAIATNNYSYNESADKELPVYYIDMTPEEWEKFYLTNPYFIEYGLTKRAIFRLKEDAATRNICYKCGRNSMSLHQEWREVVNTGVTCPGMSYGTDNRLAFTWVYNDQCQYCGNVSGYSWNDDRYSWSWSMLCHLDGKLYGIVLGASIDDGYDVHRCYSIDGNGIVHGLNCSCH